MYSNLPILIFDISRNRCYGSPHGLSPREKCIVDTESRRPLTNSGSTRKNATCKKNCKIISERSSACYCSACKVVCLVWGFTVSTKESWFNEVLVPISLERMHLQKVRKREGALIPKAGCVHPQRRWSTLDEQNIKLLGRT